MRYRKLIFPIIFLLWFANIVASDTIIINNLSFNNPQILNNRIAANGNVWNAYSRKLIMSSKYGISLAVNTVYYSDGASTFLCSNEDGHIIAQILGINFKYNSISKYLWNYSNSKFSAYSDSGLLITNCFINADSIFPYSNEVRYNKSNKIYKYVFSDSKEIFLGDYSGTFSSWFIDGEYFLTKQGSIVRLYDKNATLIKLIDMPCTENLGGSRKFFWSWTSYPYYINLYRVNNSTVSQIPFGASSKIVPTYRSIGILLYGDATFNILDLEDSIPTQSKNKGAGPYLESFNADMAGNWTTSNRSGVVNYCMQNGQPIILNYGKIRNIYGNSNGYGAIATSSGQVLMFYLEGGLITTTDTFNQNSSKIKLSLDGKYLACQGSFLDAQYSGTDQSLSVYKVADHSLIKKWYHAYNYPDQNSELLEDFDLSNDATLTSQNVFSIRNGSKYINYIAKLYTSDSTFLNNNGNYDYHSAPQISPSSKYVASSFNDLTKIYENGNLINSFTGKFGGWINDNLFVLNAVDTVICDKYHCTTLYKPNVYSLIGQIDTSYKLPFSINNLSLVSDSELYVNDRMILNNKTGDILFSFEAAPEQSASIGKDGILYVKDNALKIINWRKSKLLTLSTSAINIDSTANSSATFDITSNISWKVSSNQNWLIPSITNGSFNSTVKLTTTANTTGSLRSATITVSGNGIDSKLISVRQASIPTIINNLSEPNVIILYPNPIKSCLHVIVDEKYIENSKIDIINSIGELVGSYKLMSTDKEINLQHLSKGIYVVVISKNNLRKFSQTVVKE